MWIDAGVTPDPIVGSPLYPDRDVYMPAAMLIESCVDGVSCATTLNATDVICASTSALPSSSTMRQPRYAAGLKATPANSRYS
jgi:hypothetical protein